MAVIILCAVSGKKSISTKFSVGSEVSVLFSNKNHDSRVEFLPWNLKVLYPSAFSTDVAKVYIAMSLSLWGELVRRKINL